MCIKKKLWMQLYVWRSCYPFSMQDWFPSDGNYCVLCNGVSLGSSHCFRMEHQSMQTLNENCSQDGHVCLYVVVLLYRYLIACVSGIVCFLSWYMPFSNTCSWGASSRSEKSMWCPVGLGAVLWIIATICGQQLFSCLTKAKTTYIQWPPSMINCWSIQSSWVCVCRLEFTWYWLTVLCTTGHSFDNSTTAMHLNRLSRCG